MMRLCAVAVGMLGMMIPLLGEGPAEQLAEATSTQQLSFAPGGTIRLNNSYGDLYIEGWDRPQVEITIIKSTSYYEPELKSQAARKLETVNVAAERKSDTELAISTTLPKRAHWAPPLHGATGNGVKLEYRLYVPRNSRLVIDHHAGQVLAGNMTGDIEAANHDGDIMLLLPEEGKYSIEARSKMGHIASDFAGRTVSRYLVGERFTGAETPASRRIHLRVGFGGITILALPPEGEALASGGGGQ